METKVVFLEQENSHLQLEIQHKQDMIQKLLKNNTTLLESNNPNLSLPTQNKTDFTKSVHNEKEKKDLNISRKKETSVTMSSLQAKIRDAQEKENRNKKARRHVCIIGDSIVKHITGPGISKMDHVQEKAHPGATTDDIIGYIKPIIGQKPDIVILHTGTNELIKDDLGSEGSGGRKRY